MARDDDLNEIQPPYRVREVGRKLGLSDKAILDGIAGDRIPAFRIGRVWLTPRRWVDSRVGGEAA